MEKPKNGMHSFLPTGENAFPQPCIVVATYEDGSVNLVTWDENGQQSVVKKASLIQESTSEDGCCVPCHYAPPSPEPVVRPKVPATSNFLNKGGDPHSGKESGPEGVLVCGEGGQVGEGAPLR